MRMPCLSEALQDFLPVLLPTAKVLQVQHTFFKKFEFNVYQLAINNGRFLKDDVPHTQWSHNHIRCDYNMVGHQLKYNL